MESCEAALNLFARRRFGEWAGLPVCTLDKVTQVFPLLNQGVGSGRLFDQPAEYRMVTVDGYPRPVAAWFQDERLKMLDAEYPDPAGNLADELQSLGPPESKLDSEWDIHHLAQGEWVWPSRGISAQVNSGNRVVLRLRTFTPVSLEQYRQYLRIAWRSIEFREQ